MALARTIILLAITLSIFITPRARGADVPDRLVFEKGDALFERIGSGDAAQKLSDNAHYEKVDRDGFRYYVLLKYDDRRTWLTVLQCDSNGILRNVRIIADEKLLAVTAIMSATFLTDGRLVVDTHINPRQYITVTLDLKTGQRTILQSTD